VIAAAPPAALKPLAPAPVVVTEAPKVQALPLPAASAPQALAAASASADQAATAAATPDAKPVSPPAAPAPVAKPTPAALPLLAELPQDLRGQIPKITITGSVYSASPAQRLLLINNLVLPQGGVVESELRLEEIQPRSSVFIFKGTRFRVLH
jgi:general secretion pathway protein B